jgi:putative transposase
VKLSKEGFEQWCWRLGLSDQAQVVITSIRTLPPARHVQSSAGNMSGTYPSLKMGCAIQFESHKNELPFVYLMDHDSHVLEFYDQPVRRVGAYCIPARDGRRWSEDFWTKELT